jgi:hypothetical protein
MKSSDSGAEFRSNAMILYRRVCVVLVASLFVTAPTCSPPNPPLAKCGTFTFDPKTDSNLTGQAALFELTFTHVANNCPISCGSYWFVQVIRPLDLDSGEFIQPHRTQQERTVTGQRDAYLNGWAVDRRMGRRLGWYGVTDDFRFEPPSGVQGEVFQMGFGSMPAKMHDTLARGSLWAGKRMQIAGITVAVGLDPGTPCENKILGIQEWMVVFGHDDSRQLDTVATPTLLPSGQRELQPFLLAVDAWNKHLDDGRVRLPWASVNSAFSLP